MQVVLKAAGQRGLVPRGATELFCSFLSTDSDGDEAVLAFMFLYTIWCFIVFFLTFYVQRFLQHTVHSGEWVCHGVWMCLIWNGLVTVTFERGNSTQFFDCAWLETVKIVHIKNICIAVEELVSQALAKNFCEFCASAWNLRCERDENMLQAKPSWNITTLKYECQIYAAYAVVVIGFAAIHSLPSDLVVVVVVIVIAAAVNVA